MKSWLEKTGGISAVVAAAACPVCFPKLALLGALFGLGALVVLAAIGHVLSYTSGAAVFAGLYWAGSEALAYAGLAGLIIASATGFWTRRRKSATTTQEIQWNRK